MTTVHAAGVLTPHRQVRPGGVTIVGDGRVGELATADPAEQGLLVPGFVDLQCNGAAGHDLRDCTVEAFDGVADALLRSGTTAWCPTLPTASEQLYPRFLDAVRDAARRRGPRILGVHLEGPFLNPRRRGAHDPGLLRSPDARWLETLVDRHPDLVRIVTLAPELPGADEIIGLCVDRGIVVSLGHTDATADEAEAAFEAGASMVTHLFNAMRPIHHRDPGVLVASSVRPGVFCGMICDGVHVDPTVASLFLRSIGPGRACVVSDAVARPSPPPGLTGGFGLLDGALRNLTAWGLPMADAVRMMTATPARAVGAEGIGSLEPGSPADMVLWRDGRVAKVWLQGEPV